MKRREKVAWVVVFGAALALLLACASGCSTLDKAYRQEVTWANKPVVQVFTNQVVVTNLVSVVVERTNVVFVTNATTGAISGYAMREPVATNLVTALVTNVVPVFMTNVVQVPVTNLVERPEVVAGISAAGSVLNTFLPGVGSIVALALGGLYHGYRQVRNRKVTEALIQGVETAREVLATTPQGQAADAQFVHWLMEHQKEAGVFTTISGLVDQLTDNPAARMTALEILERLRLAEQSRVSAPVVAAPSCPSGNCTGTVVDPPHGGCGGGGCTMTVPAS